MKYYCRACSYSGNASGTSGECPGCGSYALVRSKREAAAEAPPKWRLALLIGLWTYLIILIIWKLNS